jgi:hypothetical protein
MGDSRRFLGQGMGGVVQTEAVAIAQAPVHFHAGNEVLQAEIAAVSSALQGQRAAHAQRIPEFPGLQLQYCPFGHSLACLFFRHPVPPNLFCSGVFLFLLKP